MSLNCTLSLTGFKVAFGLFWSKSANKIAVRYNHHPKNWMGVMPLRCLGRCSCFNRHCCACLLKAVEVVKLFWSLDVRAIRILKLINQQSRQHLKMFLGQNFKENWTWRTVFGSNQREVDFYKLNARYTAALSKWLDVAMRLVL